MYEQKLGNGESVFLVGLGFPQGESDKISSQKRIDDNTADSLVREKGEKVYVVASGRLHKYLKTP
jgi:hypothetical protein